MTLQYGTGYFKSNRKNQQPTAAMKNRKPNPKGKRKPDHKPELVSSFNNRVNHTHIQGPSTARCMALTVYHNIPSDFISSQQWVQVINILSFCHKTSSNKKFGHSTV
jgi:hypothetical protein